MYIIRQRIQSINVNPNNDIRRHLGKNQRPYFGRLCHTLAVNSITNLWCRQEVHEQERNTERDRSRVCGCMSADTRQNNSNESRKRSKATPNRPVVVITPAYTTPHPTGNHLNFNNQTVVTVQRWCRPVPSYTTGSVQKQTTAPRGQVHNGMKTRLGHPATKGRRTTPHPSTPKRHR